MASAIQNGVTQRRGRARRLFTAGEFFAGIGLVRLALERHLWRVDFANDIDAQKQAMYEANFGASHFVLDDIHALDAKDVPECDLFTASFPCNDLSIAGTWKGLNGAESSSYWGFVHILKEMGTRRPPIGYFTIDRWHWRRLLSFSVNYGGMESL